MIGGLGTPELIIIMIIVMVLFGGKRLPELGSGLGKALRGFKAATEEPAEVIKEAVKIDDKTPTA